MPLNWPAWCHVLLSMTQTGCIHTSLVIPKTKVAPLKRLLIPHLDVVCISSHICYTTVKYPGKQLNIKHHCCWNHVEGFEYSVDCAFRGVFPSELLSHELWWNGPSCSDLAIISGQATISPSLYIALWRRLMKFVLCCYIIFEFCHLFGLIFCLCTLYPFVTLDFYESADDELILIYNVNISDFFSALHRK